MKSKYKSFIYLSLKSVFIYFLLFSNGTFAQKRNAGFLKGTYGKKGYDWWWHSFVAKDRITGELQPFYIEYYFINPKLAKDSVVLGQEKWNKLAGNRPGYALLKCGTWAENRAVQLHNFYPMSESAFDKKKLSVHIGKSTLTETSLSGQVIVSESQASNPAWLSNAGEMSWDLKVEKKLTYDVGYGAGAFFRMLKAFKMYWHVEGMLSEFKGTVTYNGRVFDVDPVYSFGYQDKNWGVDYTNPWVWLNCNNLKNKAGEQMQQTSLDVGGGRPVVFGIPFNKKILVAFYYKGKLYEYNFSKFWKKSKTSLNCYTDNQFVYWKIDAINKNSKLEIDFKCPKNKMLKVNYENPKGEYNHINLWNGGHAEGTIKLYHKSNKKWILQDELTGSLGGCEYGEY